MTVRELREKYLRFFESKGHSRFASAPLIPIDVTGRLDESLLFTGAGMVQFKPYFRGIAKPDNVRLTNCQKVVRTGDIEDVGDPSHLTFFEMLGNFSFGDYFKAQAIAFSWEFMTSPEWLALDPQRLSFTVFEEDDEAYSEWERWLIGAGIDPATRIFRLGEETNYWPAGAFTNGPPGPCGPNSEMFYWVPNDEPPPSAPYGRDDYLRDDQLGKWREIWNDVFIQFEWQGSLKNPDRPSDGWKKDGMPPLPFQSVDTGMGLERTIATLNGHRSMYESDSFLPIFTVLHQIALEQSSNPAIQQSSNDMPVAAALYAMSQAMIPEDETLVRAARIIADHIRTACFCIADGVLPSNTGRGYVLRRLIRRAVLKGQRQLVFGEPFLYRVASAVEEAMGEHYHELDERRDVIRTTLLNEEEQFRRTIGEGSRLLSQQLKALGTNRTLPGSSAFTLYDTYGFPLEVTRELASESGFEVDLEGFEVAMKEAQERSRSVGGGETVYGGVTLTIELSSGQATPAATEFLGYDCLEAEAMVIGAVEQEGKLLVALDKTPFYAASGGQVSDHGWLDRDGVKLEVEEVSKQGGIVIHHITHPSLTAKEVFGSKVTARVDPARRARIRRNHTATHLLHAALRDTLGKHVTQAGSYVGPDRLRFDFTHGKAMTADELKQVEAMVNEKVLKNLKVVTHVDVPIVQAKRMGAMALFGEKYGDSVRVVQVGDEMPAEPSYSRELCGGTHVRSTGEIGLFKIVSEGSAASGVRRIEAVTGEGFYEWALAQSEAVREAASLLKANPSDLVKAVAAHQQSLAEERKKREKAERQLVGGKESKSSPKDQAKEVGPVKLWTAGFEDVDPKIVANSIDNAVASDPYLVALAGLKSDGKVQFIGKVGQEALAKGAHAGNLVREVAKIAGGGGGGRPDFATAGGKDPSKLADALQAAEGILREMVGG